MSPDPHAQTMTPKIQPCQKCGEREGTMIWSEGSIAYAHGLYARWCKVCVLRAQIEHAEKAADTLSMLRAELDKELSDVR